jgi:hypothetical protein
MKENNKITWETIEDLESFFALKIEWEDFYIKNSTNIPFTSPTWLITWINNYWKKNWDLKVLVGRTNDLIVTIVPMYIQNTQTVFNKSSLYPIGIGEPELKEVSTEYLDIIILPEFQKLALIKIKQWVLNLNVDEIIWHATLQDSNISILCQSFDLQITKSEATSYIVDCQSWSPDKLTKNMRSRYKRGLNQLSKLEAKVDWVKKEDFDDYWQVMKGFHQNRWLNKDKTGAFCCDEFNLFHTEFRKQAPNSIQMSAIWVNDSPIAIHYYFVDSSSLYFYQSGWNESEHSKLSPGLILHLWRLENNNKTCYAFVMGKKQDSYKAKFSTQDQPMYNINVTFSPIKLMLYRVLNKMKLIE